MTRFGLIGLALVMPAAAMVSACSANSENVDVAIQKTLPEICSAASTGLDMYHALITSGAQMPTRTTRVVNAAEASLAPICAEPDKATAASVLVRAASAYAAISQAVHDAAADKAARDKADAVPRV